MALNGNWPDRIVVTIAMGLGMWWLQNTTARLERMESQYYTQNGADLAEISRIRALQIEVMRRLIDVERHQDQHLGGGK